VTILRFRSRTGRHVDFPRLFADAKFLTSLKQRSDFGAMNDVLAGEARNIRTRPADIPALDDRDMLSLFGQSPANELSSFAAA
jgi:hypothetical protein